MSEHNSGVVLILGSAPGVIQCRDWPRAPFDTIVAINNAWAVRPDWDVLIRPEDFPADRMPPTPSARQRIVGAEAFVPAQNHHGGFVFAGGTMAFTAAYWVLHALRPRVIAFLGCDMVYETQGSTHFYGTGTADPLRDDITLRDLGAKSARLGVIAAQQGCACVNLSQAVHSSLLFARATPQEVGKGINPVAGDTQKYAALRNREAALGYDTPDGRYWEMAVDFDSLALAGIDRAWRELFGPSTI
ncbi:MAG: hypothetical protein WBB25_06550 [Sulfitobacter sp.]